MHRNLQMIKKQSLPNPNAHLQEEKNKNIRLLSYQ